MQVWPHPSKRQTLFRYLPGPKNGVYVGPSQPVCSTDERIPFVLLGRELEARVLSWLEGVEKARGIPDIADCAAEMNSTQDLHVDSPNYLNPKPIEHDWNKGNDIGPNDYSDDTSSQMFVLSGNDIFIEYRETRTSSSRMENGSGDCVTGPYLPILSPNRNAVCSFAPISPYNGVAGSVENIAVPKLSAVHRVLGGTPIQICETNAVSKKAPTISNMLMDPDISDLSPNVTPFRKGRGLKRARCRSYYDEDIVSDTWSPRRA
ncbi:hypothetical protein FQN57_004887 [Myotisia sp. PD_48]|nr:hypothetical protein FQN57_004887 [Myotisia sp. PD_48]